MADNQETPRIPPQTNTPGTTTENESNPASPVKQIKNWIKGMSQSKNKSGITPANSKVIQFVAPDGSKIDITMHPENITILTTKNKANEQVFNQEVGTRKPAKGKHFIALTNIPELGAPTNRWILGSITEPSTSRKRASTTKFTENWHNFLFLKSLNGPDDWQNLVGTGRSINLKMGTHWCAVTLNVPVTALDLHISSAEGRVPNDVISPTRKTQEQINTEEEETEQSNPTNDLIDLLSGSNNQLDIFSQDNNTSNSRHTIESITLDGPQATTTSNSEKNKEPSEPNPLLLLSQDKDACSQQEKEQNTNIWINDPNNQTSPSFLPPASNLGPPNETMALSDVSGFTSLTFASQATTNWFSDSSIPSNIKSRLLTLQHYDRWMASINKLGTEEMLTAALALRNLKKFTEEAVTAVFATGCMVQKYDLTQVDPLSQAHASKHFLGSPVKKYLRALRSAKTRTMEAMHHLEALCGFDGNPEFGQLAIWTKFRASPAAKGHVIGLLSPVTVLEKDYDFFNACIEILKLRVYRENNPSPKPGPSTSKKSKQVVVESSIASPVNPQPPRSVSRASSRRPASRAISILSRTTSEPTPSISSNQSHNWRETLDILQAKLEDRDKQAIKQKEQAEMEKLVQQQMNEHNKKVEDMIAVMEQEKLQQELELKAAKDAELSSRRKEEHLLEEQKQKEADLKILQEKLQSEQNNRAKEAAGYEEVIKVHEKNMQLTDKLVTSLPDPPASGEQQSLHNLRKDNKDLHDKLRVEQNNRAKETAEHEEALKTQKGNMQRNNKPVTSPQESPISTEQQRMHNLRQLIDAHISEEDKWIFTEEPMDWKDYLPQKGTMHPSSQDEMHPAMQILLSSSTLPLWAVNQNTSKELSRAMAAFKTMEFAERDIMRCIKDSPQQEDEIKQFLKMSTTSHQKTIDKLQQSQSTLSQAITESVQLPVPLVSAIRKRIINSELLFKQYQTKLSEITARQKQMGISINTTNQTLTQTEELMKTFSGQGALSYPQWQFETFSILQSSGISKALWYNLILKKVTAPAITKISQSSISSKDVDKILEDLKRHYNKSMVIAAAIYNCHFLAGKIPDPEFDIANSLPTLTAHHEALIATEQFLQHSDLLDKEDAIFQSNTINDLILLMPDRIRINHKDGMFQSSSCTSGAARTRHQAFSTWVRQTRSKLLVWDVETQARTNVHQAMVGVVEEQSTSAAQPALQQQQQLENIVTRILAKHTKDNKNQYETQTTDRREQKAKKITDCVFCELLKSTDHATTKVADAITKLDFDKSHYQFRTQSQDKYILPPNGCLQMITATLQNRLQAIKKKNSVCSLCLAQPRQWNHSGTTCKDTHAVKRRADNKINAVCMQESCNTHFLICKPHQKENAMHPFAKKAMSRLAEATEDSQELKEAGPPTEWIMMANAGNIWTHSEVSAPTTYNQEKEESMKLTIATMAHALSELAKRVNLLEPIQQQTTFKIEQPENSSFPVTLPTATAAELSVATACMISKIYNKQNLPECVSTTDEEFTTRNTPAVSSDLVDRTQGKAIYLFIDLWGNNGKSIRTVFDSGATISLWLNQVIENGLLEAKIDVDSEAIVNGIGQNKTKAVTCTVILPGNLRNPETNNFINYICKSTMVKQIIPPQQQTNQTNLIDETITNIKQHPFHSKNAPQDMITENFQTEIGGTIQGLIGAKHLRDFPVPVMHLDNGLSIYKHSLRPAHNRSKVYCIGGSMPVLAAFQRMYGPQFQNMAMMCVYDFDAVKTVLFDGDMTDTNVRNSLPALQDESFRHQQGEEDCKKFQIAMNYTTCTDNSNNQEQLNFCAPASNRTTP